MERHLYSHMSAEEKDKSGLKKRCATCGREFKDKKAYAAHILAHKGQQFACDQCPKTFHWKQGLRRHVVNVHGKPPKIR
ncbi:Gastrula zinc finger protein xFG20-1 [Orchesella cincta]|uniref:Gastrula zinc finger protein xFG20-1 n=1 Tax=Orchesella cincta TaxID=48709 RepID=A0A1D2M5M7_ORCCI|nr:Gastrula zinc finger protein xFG20-1 [Orchesella cincta]